MGSLQKMQKILFVLLMFVILTSGMNPESADEETIIGFELAGLFDPGNIRAIERLFDSFSGCGKKEKKKKKKKKKKEE